MALRSRSSSFSYDVFLSFRGLDTRYGFTGNLYKALDDRGIHTFIDDEELQGGEEITTALMKAIEESRIAITVLSINYASSSFCLDELATILHCAQRKGLSVIPVFYNVDPYDVRHQKGSYGEAMAKHERRRFQHDPEKLQKWKMALRQVADFSGYHFKDGASYEYKFIGSIVEQVSREINRAPLHVADYPVGLGSQVLRIRNLLDVGSNDVVHIIGIHGMGGLGKTTLALAIYNLIVDHFDGSCFLENVREKSKKHGLEHLQSIFLSNILGEKDINLTSKQQGISMIQSRLKGKKVLLILDDVDRHKQLQAIVGRLDWFGPGSRIIITTRDKQLLKSHEVERTHEVELLNENDSLQLLTWNAFKKEKADPRYKEVLNRAVSYAFGLPLALEVIGSHLFGKSIEEWESAIKQYKRIPKKEILEILKVSFDALEEEEKNVFLDIACCLKGCKLTEVEHILCALYDVYMKNHIGVLVEKSLIKVNCDRVQMHDLIQDMGRRIDQQESPKELGKRRRLWLPKDINQVLKDNTGTSKIEIICLDFAISHNEEPVEWNGNAFKKMKSLKILIIRNGKFSKGPKYFPESLRVLEWHRYPSNCLPSNFDLNKLVICKLPDSCITSFEFHVSSKKIGNLTVLNFDHCKFLTQIPDVSYLTNLKEFSLSLCRNLIKVHDSIGFLNKLQILDAFACDKLTSFPRLNLTSLERLELSCCTRLESFPEISGKMKNIRKLSLGELSITEFPLSLQNLTGLEYLDLGCENVMVRSSIVMMPELSEFHAYRCKGWQWVKSKEGEEKVGSIVSSKLNKFSAEYCNLDDDFFSTGFTQFAHVSSLDLQGNNFTILPECIKEFQFLSKLDVSGCNYLQEIRGVPPNLKDFRARNCTSLTSLSTSMLLNKELHKAGKTSFCFGGANIPKWFDHQSRGPSTSFWFRNKFPARVLSLLIAPAEFENEFACPTPMVFINGKLQEICCDPNYNEVMLLDSDHTYLFDLHRVYALDDLFGMAIEKEWIHVEITYEDVTETSFIKATGIHVFKQESSMDDIRFDDSYGKRKVDDNLNSWESQPLVKIIKHRFVDTLWRWVGLERIKILLLKVANEALITNAERRRRNNSMDSSCPRCHLLEETCLHALRDCPEVADFWRDVLTMELELTFFNISDVTVWLERNLSFSEHPVVAWPTMFGVAVEVLWQSRNELVFHQKASSPNDIAHRVHTCYEDLTRPYSSHTFLRNHFKLSINPLKWYPPSAPWLKLNVTGAFDPSSGTAACGGIFRDHRGRFMLGFSVKLGECSIDEAGIWGVYHGIQIARQHHFHKIVVELDLQKAIRFVQDGCPTLSQQHCFPLRHELQALTYGTDNLCWSLISRKANMVAYSFAKFGLSMHQTAWIFSARPSFCRTLIR